MSGKEILVDTNIIIYLLAGSLDLEKYLQGKNIYISFITELELLGYQSITPEHESYILDLLKDCFIIQMNNSIREKYISLTRIYKFQLPDALIAATALAFDIPLITSDKGFQRLNELTLVYYQRPAKLAEPGKGKD